jgi:hypothetical protein
VRFSARRAHAVLYDRHSAAIYRYVARRFGAAAADDIVADCFLVPSAEGTAMTFSKAARGRGYTASHPTSSASTGGQRYLS